MSPPSNAADAPVKAADLVRMLEQHYRGAPGGRDADAYATYAELTHPSGGRCDFMSVGLWASRGHLIYGHEIKTSRADWLAELNKPSKADLWWGCCHRWWLVVPSADLVREGELPDGWGLMVPRAGARRMRVIVSAAARHVTPPMWLLTAMVKREQRARDNVVRDAEYRGRQAGMATERERADQQALSAEQKRRLDTLAGLEKALGITIDQYGGWGDGPIDPELGALALRVARALRGIEPRYGDGLSKLVALADRVGAAGRELAATYADVLNELVAKDSVGARNA